MAVISSYGSCVPLSTIFRRRRWRLFWWPPSSSSLMPITLDFQFHHQLLLKTIIWRCRSTVIICWMPVFFSFRTHVKERKNIQPLEFDVEQQYVVKNDCFFFCLIYIRKSLGFFCRSMAVSDRYVSVIFTHIYQNKNGDEKTIYNNRINEWKIHKIKTIRYDVIKCIYCDLDEQRTIFLLSETYLH